MRWEQRARAGDYLRLPPGGMVGFEDQYRGCTVMHPGTYKITALYYAQDLHIDKVRFVAEKAEEIVTGQVRSEPSTFRVRDSANKLRD